MSQSDDFLAELDQELKTTRRVLERVPSDKGEWKPHAKSFSLGHLAQLVSRMPGWIASAVRDDVMDLAGYPGYSYQPTDALLKDFDAHVADTRAALGKATDAALATSWSLTRGSQVFFSMPKRVAVRQHINHLVHHRAQLGVYLRLLDVPVPSMYGPTADEPMSLG